MLLAIAAAVGAGYMPTEDPLQMIGAANASAMLSVRTQRQATRQWLDQVVKNFGSQKQHHHVSTTACIGQFTTTLPALHLHGDSHWNRCLFIDHPQRPGDWLLNLPPPSCN